MWKQQITLLSPFLNFAIALTTTDTFFCSTQPSLCEKRNKPFYHEIIH